MQLDELAVARIARYAAEINLARAQMEAVRAAMLRAQQSEVEALDAYCEIHRTHGLDPDAVTVLTRDVTGPLGKLFAGTVVTKPDALGQGGGIPWERPAVTAADGPAEGPLPILSALPR